MISDNVNKLADKVKVLIIGKHGQLARSLVDTAPHNIELLSLARSGINLLDLSNIEKAVARFKPNTVINASGYTDVESAESDATSAFSVNETAVENIATVTSKNNIRLIHISSDFVFDGTSKVPYSTNDKPNPLSIYGASKLAGERALTRLQPNNSSVIRTSWLYSPYGNNFVKTMLNLMSTKEHLNVVSDQIGCPTNANKLALFIWQLTTLDTIYPFYHWSDLGSTSWYEFAIEIQNIGVNLGLLTRKIPINSIKSFEYPSNVKRPKYSVLDTSNSQSILAAKDWREELAEFLKKLKER
ncbi:NAD(P)-dependent oxidoreductase [Shewanella hanedai]|uniref:dTDP-4-dehydrorhamnose reductase n=2 Tax=Shewanella hanedai TaxID=25 RepID=A0A553JTG8_SHEHA|nr:dTDP-4-dehydrorhamnose reductase [Shewanella hanedai]TRY15755.1 dTDP-4-dehydrorhamnose reductase [Shewanella hanedai]GGI71208.1 NAD(P)-dependent oxidoreductase [Shewanella hanedai]